MNKQQKQVSVTEALDLTLGVLKKHRASFKELIQKGKELGEPKQQSPVFMFLQLIDNLIGCITMARNEINTLRTELSLLRDADGARRNEIVRLRSQIEAMKSRLQ